MDERKSRNSSKTIENTVSEQLFSRRESLATLGAAVVTGCVAPAKTNRQTGRESERNPWPMYGHGLRNRAQTDGGVSTAGIDERWASRLNGNVTTSPSVGSALAITTAGQDVSAFEKDGGSLRWQRSLPVTTADITPAVTSEAVYVAGRDESAGILLALDPADGSTLWRIPMPVASPPVVTRGTVYITNQKASRPYLTAINARTGDRRWRQSLTQGSVMSRPAFDADSNAYITTTWKQKLRLFRAEPKGTRLVFETKGRARSAPTIMDGRAYLTNFEGTVHAVDLSTGEELWTFETRTDISTSPAVDDEYLYVNDMLGSLYAINIEDGVHKWTRKTSATTARPTIAHDTVLVGGSSLSAVDAKTGDRRWKFTIPAHSVTIYSPAPAAGSVYATACTKSEPREAYDNYLYRLQ